MATVDEQLWLSSIATYGIGDVVTTYTGLNMEGVSESHPVADQVLQETGVGGMIGMKIVTLTGFGLLYGAAPDDWKVGVPTGLTTLGTLIVLNNVRVIARATGVL
jgi:hypothetical protein